MRVEKIISLLTYYAWILLEFYFRKNAPFLVIRNIRVLS